MKTNQKSKIKNLIAFTTIGKALLMALVLQFSGQNKVSACGSPNPDLNLCAPFEITRGNSFVGAQVIRNGSYSACPGTEEWYGVNYIGGTDAFLEYTVLGGEITGISGTYTNPLPPAQTFGSTLNVQALIRAGYEIENYPRIRVKWYNLTGSSYNYGIIVRTNKSGVFGACGPRTASFDFTVNNLPSTGITANIGNSVPCINYGGTFNIPFVQGASYQWKLNGNNISGATNNSVYISNFSQPSNTVSVDVSLPCFSRTYTYGVNVEPQADLFKLANDLRALSFTPNCTSNSKDIQLPYIDGSSKFVLSIPTSSGYTFNGGLRTVTVNENISQKINFPSILNTGNVNIKASLQQSCGGLRTISSDIVIFPYNPISTATSLNGTSNLCIDNFSSGSFNLANPINNAIYTWSLNSIPINSVYFNPNGLNLNNLTFPVSGSQQIANVGSNTLSVTLSNVPCVASTTNFVFSRTFVASAIGSVSPNPISVDPGTGKATTCVIGGSTNNTYNWNPAPFGYAITSPVGGTGSNCAEFTLTNPNGVDNAFANVSINNPVCGTQSRQFVISSSKFSYSIQPSFSTACVGNSVTLNRTLSGGRTPYGTGTWKTRNPAQQSLITSQNATSCTISSPIAQFVTVYYEIKDANNISATGADATINFSNTANSNVGGWASGQLVNTACATNYAVLSNNFIAQNDSYTNFIFFLGTDNQLHYYYYDRFSQYCTGTNAWVEDQGLEQYFNGPVSLGSLTRRPKSGTPIAGGIDANNQLGLYYIDNLNRLRKIEGTQPTIQTYSANVTNLPKNLLIDNGKMYVVDGNTIRRQNDLSDFNGDFTPFTNVINASTGSYLAIVGTNLYYTGSNNNLWRTDINGAVPTDLGRPMLTGTDIKVADGNLVFLKDAITLTYYSPSNPSSSVDISLPAAANGRLFPISSLSAARRSIFVTGTNGNQYQVYLDGTWKVIKATSANVSDGGSGFITYNGSNVLYLTSGNTISNLFGTGCGNFVRKEQLVNNSQEINQYTVYPNPFSNSLSLDIATPESDKISLELIDVLGNTVFTFAEKASISGSRTYQLNTSQVAKGVYTIKITDEKNRVYFHKLIAE